MGGFRRSLPHTLRLLGRNPGFATVAALSLALAIGANTAIFSLLNALLLRNLAVPQPERLVELSVVRRGDKIPFSFPMYREIARGQRVFSNLIAWSFGSTDNVEVNGVLSRATVRAVSGNYYSELGTRPAVGRLIAPGDVNFEGGAVSPVAVVSYEFWQRRFGGARDIAGKQISVGGQPFTIVGVAQKWFAGMTTGTQPDVTIPMKADDNRAILWVFLTGRLKDGIDVAQARAQLQALWPAVRRATTSSETPGLRRQAFFAMGLDVAPAARGVNDPLREHFTRPLYLLMGIAGLILLVACVNLANLMLARAAARGHEMSVRAALGASRGEIAREVLAESLALSACGALAGLAFAYGGSRLLVDLLSDGYLTPVLLDLRPDWRVLAVTAAVAILTGVLSGLAPAWRSSREDPAAVLRQGTRSLTGATRRLGKSLVVTQIALSLVLLAGAGLLLRSFLKLRSLDPGLMQSVLEVNLAPRPGGHQNVDLGAYRGQLLERIARLPGVDSAAFSDMPIADNQPWRDTVSTMADATSPSAGVMSMAALVSPGFFRASGNATIGGRNFDDRDDGQHPHVAILSHSLAARLFPSGNAIGQRIRFGFMPEMQNLEVIGMAGDARLFDLRNPAAPVVYLPHLQYPEYTRGGCLLVRARRNPAALAGTIGREIESFGHEYAESTKTMAEAAGQALVEERVIAVLSGFFAVLALLLASIGLYGLMSYTVARRTREIGIRVAVGAQGTAILWLVLRESLALGIMGIALGVPCALAASRLLTGVLFGVPPHDAATLAVVSLLLMPVALLAACLPARRAARLDSVTALRTD